MREVMFSLIKQVTERTVKAQDYRFLQMLFMRGDMVKKRVYLMAPEGK